MKRKTFTTSKDPVRFAVLSTDTVVLTVRDGELLVRLIKIDRPPFFIQKKGLPGGLIDPKETAEQAAERHVEHKAAISDAKLYTEQLYTFSRIDRDPRNRVVAVAYLALVPWQRLSPEEQVSTDEAWWFPLNKARKLAYDHDEMLTLAYSRLRSRIAYTTIISKLMSKEFTLTELEKTYESILGARLDKRNFRKKILKLDIIEPTPGKRTGGRFRPAQLYRFVSNAVKEIDII